MIKSCYIHIPFCKKICSYCDFCKIYYNEIFINKYLDALEKEIDTYYKGELLDTLYIGGGTPSSLSLEELNRLFNILKRLNTSDKLEYTIESNIEDITEDKLKLFKNNGINRISIGVESFNEDNLKFMNRPSINLDKLNLVKKYFDNINIDLIYALPNETLDILNSDLDKVLEFNPKHISIYSLIIENNTMIRDLEPIDDELDYEMYKLICDRLSNYNHYEISNFAIPGYESKHNLTYWNNDEYYGFGMGASGYVNDIRYTNTKSINHYIKNEFNRVEEHLTLLDKEKYELIMGFRKLSGINLNTYKEKYNKDLLDNKIINKLLSDNKLQIKDNNIFINNDYIYLQNEILLELI
ncbi:MAG: radical SAM family heme chaperone HemW [Bacilli bacterium]|nr:radical SAM family heme chaperone HemW [Bacilli bacterium]